MGFVNIMNNKLILGTVQFGLNYGINNSFGKPNYQEVNKILITASKKGINLLDTAEIYGNAQELIGEFHKNNPLIRFKVITKLYDKKFSGNFEKQVNNNLKKLNVKSLYAYMFHNKSDLFKYKGSLNSLYNLKQQGLIDNIGVSLYTNDEIKEVLDSNIKIDLVQLPFNLLDNNNKRLSVLKKLKEQKIEIHTRSVFLQGLFFMNKTPDNLKVFDNYIKHLKILANKYKIDINEMALNYSISNKFIDKVLIGVDTNKQLLENISLINKLPDGIVNDIDKIDFKEIKYLNPANW